MSSLKTQALLVKAAKLYQKDKEKFSKTEILKKINEVKYLSSQKKVPKLTLRKEILHLEDKLQGIFELEKKLLKEKKSESVKVSSLKRQVTLLKKKLATSNDPHIHKKVNKLSHHIGEYLAKEGAREDVALQEQIESFSLDEDMIKRIRIMEEKVEGLQHELDIEKRLETKYPEKISVIEEKIFLVKEKLDEYYEKYPELRVKEEEPVINQPVETQPEIKHTLMFNQNLNQAGVGNVINEMLLFLYVFLLVLLLVSISSRKIIFVGQLLLCS